MAPLKFIDNPTPLRDILRRIQGDTVYQMTGEDFAMNQLASRVRSDDVEKGDIVQLWMCRILRQLGGYKEFIQDIGYSDNRIASELGLNTHLDYEDADTLHDFNKNSALRNLQIRSQHFESRAEEFTLHPELATNIQNLANALTLSDVDQKILGFTVMLHADENLSNVAETLGSMTFNKICHTLAITLELPLDDVTNTLRSNGRLSRTSIVYVDHDYTGHLRGKLEIISREFASRMLMPANDPIHLLRDTILACSPSELHIQDYAHISKTIDILIPYLRRSSDEVKNGVNILIYGPPGTGKSQLSRVIAQELNIPLYEVSRENSDGDAIDGKKRLRAYRAAQNIFEGHKNILLFDEVEDIFDDGSPLFGIKSTASKHKGWINRTLEESAIPTIWLTNTVEFMDPAFLRRFDLVFELPVPPYRQRTSITEKLCRDLAPVDAIARIANSEYVTPAIIHRASKVINAIKDDIPNDLHGSSIEHLVENTLVAQGHPTLGASYRSCLPDYYDPSVVNVDMDLAVLSDNLIRAKSGRLCIYGPPGTGKTAYARWVSLRMNVPLHVKRVSDLQDMWVGNTEKNIAKAFREAEQDNAILLIDEVDSFLQDRRKAQRSWEVSAVNEMLTQMESFQGIFMASTNLVDDLDQASLRRFDLKVKFDYLRTEQALNLFSKVTNSLGIEVTPESNKRITHLGVLTPGDYNVITRRHRFQPFSSAEEVAKVLEEECALKEDGKPKRAIGFIQNSATRTDS